MKALIFFFLATIAVLISGYSQGQVSTVKEDLLKAQSLAEQGNAAEASGIYTQMMGKYPDNKEAVQGWLILNMKRSPTGEEEAIKQLEELEKTYPKNTAILFFKIFIQAEYNHNEEALESIDRLIAIQPDTSVNWLLKGQILESMNKDDEALEACGKATALDPDNSDAWQIRAGLLAKTNKLDEAIVSYSRAIQLAPRQPVFLYNRGCVYCRKGDKENALDDLGKAVSMNPQLKSHATMDEDFRSLWEDADFKKIVSQ